MRTAVALAAFGLVLCGCAPVHRVDPVTSTHERERLNRVLQGRRASVELVGMPEGSGSSLRAENIRVAADSTSMTLLRKPGKSRALMGEPIYRVRRDTTLRTSVIGRVLVRRSPSGAILGLLRGALWGAGAGALLGAVTYGGPDLIVDSPAVAAGLGAIVFGIAGAGVGLVGGLILGATEVYEFQ